MTSTRQIDIRLPHHDTQEWEAVVTILNEQIKDGQKLGEVVKELSGMGAPSLRWFQFPENFFSETLPFVRDLVLELPVLFPEPIQHLVSVGQIVLSRRQVACLIATSFFGCFGRQYIHGYSLARHLHKEDKDFPQYLWPDFDISGLFFGGFAVNNFVRCIIHYFKRIHENMPTGNIIITRKELIDIPDYSNMDKPLCEVEISPKPIEDHFDHLYHGDFANEYIGGGALSGGNVQEEILFVLKPECLVSMLICSKMEPDEAIIISGAERFSSHRGYGGSFEWTGNFDDPTPRDDVLNIVANHVVGIDAIVARGNSQFEPEFKIRDINKCYIGISLLDSHKHYLSDGSPHPTFVTGNWGCGMFGGDKQLKFMQQLIATSAADFKKMIYCPFSEVKFSHQLECLMKYLKDKNPTLGELYKAVMDYRPTEGPGFMFADIAKVLAGNKDFDLNEYYNESKSLESHSHAGNTDTSL
eukprot:TRINITY_DN5598_c0_g1_i1.p1 TRINITY_DN5598_c0_g1~~TRINITY_DN5598_c0_g1_i1.p1  ORF type:complete len:470 (-),score=61.03 TRINITY_DN5598_c0_g1_i1:36-1445(-)